MLMPGLYLWHQVLFSVITSFAALSQPHRQLFFSSLVPLEAMEDTIYLIALLCYDK